MLVGFFFFDSVIPTSLLVNVICFFPILWFTGQALTGCMRPPLGLNQHIGNLYDWSGEVSNHHPRLVRQTREISVRNTGRSLA